MTDTFSEIDNLLTEIIQIEKKHLWQYESSSVMARRNEIRKLIDELKTIKDDD